MKVELFDFQKDTLSDLRTKLKIARKNASVSSPQAIAFSAPTGAGKTIIMTALFEDIFFGSHELDAQSDAVILWISDLPELNEQTRLKIEGKSDRIRVRQLVNIDASFDFERFEGGHIYFMNTQKLGSEKLLTRPGDGRQYTIWQTLTNTAQFTPDRFYVVIDEAHRGMGNGKAATIARTIMQRFLLGSPDDGLCLMPLVIGITATPTRFETLLSGTIHTVHKVFIKSEDVRESGLIKDRILIDHPLNSTQAEMTILAQAAGIWQNVERRWFEYCDTEDVPLVRPILVIQVEDGTDKTITKTDLNACLNTLESAIGRQFRDGEVTHTFHDVGELNVNGRKVLHIMASRIEEDPNISVVLFKMNLSTGWDCPRAEVMMSFRSAEDHTYIAQLLGRMVRTPLACRIESDSDLNDVYLFLPHYDSKTVESVIKDLKNVEDVPPTTIGTRREQVTLYRRDGLDELFNSMAKLVTYRVNAVRKQSALRRLMSLVRGLTFDRLDTDALDRIKGQVLEKISTEIRQLKDLGLFDDQAKRITGIDLKTIVVDYGSGKLEDNRDYTIEAVSVDIDRYFHQAGRLLGNGLEMDYWRSQEDREANEVKVEIVVLSHSLDAMKALENFAELEFNKLYEQYKRDIAGLKEIRRKHYERARLATSDPQYILWSLQKSIDFSRSTKAQEYDKHIYIEDDGKFRADLGTWEREVLETELKDSSFVGWLRNVDRKNWSFEIPYRYAGNIKPMFPDFIVIRKDTKGYLFDILEPHDPSLKDNFAKAVGLAEFAEKHWDLFQRIQLIRKKRGVDGLERYFRLDVGIEAIRKKILAVSDNITLDQIFEAEASV